MKYLSLVLLLISAACYAQIPEPALISLEGFGGNSYEGIGKNVQRCPDGGFILMYASGSVNGNIPTNCPLSKDGLVFFKKYDASGANLIWEKCFSDAEIDTTYLYCFETVGKNILLGGTEKHHKQLIVRKEDATGNILWIKGYGGSHDQRLKGMEETSDGGYVLYAETSSDDGDVGSHYGSYFYYDLWAIKIDSNGNKLWSKVVGGSSEEEGSGIAPGLDGGVYIVGRTVSSDFDCTGTHFPGQSFDAYIARIDGQSNLLWHRCMAGGSGALGFAVTSNGSGGAYFAAANNGNGNDVSDGIGSYDFWVTNLDSNNNALWSHCFGGQGYEIPNDICVASDGTIWVAGITQSYDGQVGKNYGLKDAWVVNIDAQGKYIRSKVVGSIRDDYGEMVYPLTNNMLLFGGTYGAPGSSPEVCPTIGYGQSDIFLAKLAPWNTEVKTPLNQKSIEIFPNPTTEKLYIKNSGSRYLSVKIANAIGQEVYSNRMHSSLEEINVSTWNEGIYYVIIQDGEGVKEMIKVSKL